MRLKGLRKIRLTRQPRTRVSDLIIAHYISRPRMGREGARGEWPSVFSERQLGPICCGNGPPLIPRALILRYFSTNFRVEFEEFLRALFTFKKEA